MFFQLFYFGFVLICFVRNFECPNEKYIEDKLSEVHIPGAAILVVNQSSILYEKSFGYQSISSFRSIQINQSIFTLASISKTFLSIGIMQLVELNLLNLDENINKYLNENIHNPLFPSIPITLRHLLSHQSSINSNQEIHLRENDQAFEQFSLTDYCLNYFQSNQSNWLNSPPGSVTVYSNEGIALVAVIIERISNMSFENYIQTKILKPLNINPTKSSYRLNQLENLDDVVEQYAFISNSNEFSLWKESFPQLNLRKLNESYPTYIHIPLFSFPVYPSGLLRMSAIDLAKFVQMFMNNGSPLIQKQSIHQIKQIQSNQTLSNVQFALVWNWRTSDDGTQFIGHRGTNFGSTHLMLIDQENTIGIIILTNADISLPNHLSTNISNTLTDIHSTLFHCFRFK